MAAIGDLMVAKPWKPPSNVALQRKRNKAIFLTLPQMYGTFIVNERILKIHRIKFPTPKSEYQVPVDGLEFPLLLCIFLVIQTSNLFRNSNNLELATFVELNSKVENFNVQLPTTGFLTYMYEIMNLLKYKVQ